MMINIQIQYDDFHSLIYEKSALSTARSELMTLLKKMSVIEGVVVLLTIKENPISILKYDSVLDKLYELPIEESK